MPALQYALITVVVAVVVAMSAHAVAGKLNRVWSDVAYQVESALK